MWRIARPDAVSVMYDEKARSALGRYFRVVEDELPARFTIARMIPVDFDPTDALDDLWSAHDKGMEEFRRSMSSIQGLSDLGSSPRSNLLELKRSMADRLMEHCILCERRCGVNRKAGERGDCGAGADLTVSSMFEHHGEEPELVPSFTVFTMGCSFHCLHCQNYTVSQWLEKGDTMSPQYVAEGADKARRAGARNLNCVGGNPDQYLSLWLEVFLALEENIPVVWNSNAYYSQEQARLLDGVVDIYLLDFKYGNDDCAREISGVDRYMRTITENLLMAKESAEVIVRVLVLPDHLDCCLDQILRWVSKNLGTSTRVNLMWQYRPEWKAHTRKELSRRLTRSEMVRSMKMAREAGLTNVIT